MTAEHVESLEKKISRLIKKANKKKKKAKKAKVKRYFEGQNDAFEQILIELKNLKYELETSVEDDEKKEQELPEEGENLLKKALDKGVIIRKTSFYFHGDFPNGKVHGKKKVLQAIMERNLHKKIQDQIARAEAQQVSVKNDDESP